MNLSIIDLPQNNNWKLFTLQVLAGAVNGSLQGNKKNSKVAGNFMSIPRNMGFFPCLEIGDWNFYDKRRVMRP